MAGAGGGGFFLLYAPPESRDRVKQALAEDGLKEMHFGFDFHSARVVDEDPFFDSGRRGELVREFVKLS